MANCACHDEKITVMGSEGQKLDSLFTGVRGPDGKIIGPRKLFHTSGMTDEEYQTYDG